MGDDTKSLRVLVMEVKLSLIVPMRDGPGHGQAAMGKLRGPWREKALLPDARRQLPTLPPLDI